ncbi:hypothetical protein A3G63_02935 [Candidatus Kaiserbacteria bacterium RIFCSPLOWO2_12_FULL_52_8]|uniref:Peptidase M50 domain-containing protein n=1 Tax=Candidatus Kaiserbacteria bacterium RIFCSPHIGHO2_01_FULL_53_31 TaxID=1798481 RepID=A0A1F6CII5_9BACT|nr:MAG: hypothetical protein A2678_01250 [Candidatus Kaiserbacteria bacterium RIFCSPHIGHO2_01_FULL_53_31]OGG94550.1 MAG: hypothetical protein A3G63_02935 [Candidatus Kaiserbacteria bacterium RIFCSPLOWO2_12_FULL_52_8]
MEILIFILVIVALIVVHEFGHFVAAKLSGMRVDEFGLGYPPRAATIATVGETRYTLNWIPFGGFVKIYGEDGLENEQQAGGGNQRAFANRPRVLQAIVLIAGVAMNLLFAYALITGALIAGTPRALAPDDVATASHVQLAVAGVLSNSPAALAGIIAGDTITSAVDSHGAWHPGTGDDTADPESFTQFVSRSEGGPLILSVVHNGVNSSLTAIPVRGIVPDDPSRYALGVEVATIGVIPLSVGEAFVEGAQLTWGATKLTAVGLWQFFSSVFTLTANFSQVAGPVGIAGVVGSASMEGVGSLLSIMAIISINLAIINLIPVPALDGGRLLFVIIEGFIRRPIRPRIAQTVNSIGFAFLVLLMLVVTAHDIFKILG